MVHVAITPLTTEQHNMNANVATTSHIARTKLDARATEKTATQVTIDWSGISIDDTRKLAAKSILIAAQSEWRTAGNVPESVTLDAHTYANPARKPRGPVDIKSLLAKMSPEERAALLEQFA